MPSFSQTMCANLINSTLQTEHYFTIHNVTLCFKLAEVDANAGWITSLRHSTNKDASLWRELKLIKTLDASLASNVMNKYKSAKNTSKKSCSNYEHVHKQYI